MPIENVPQAGDFQNTYYKAEVTGEGAAARITLKLAESPVQGAKTNMGKTINDLFNDLFVQPLNGIKNLDKATIRDVLARINPHKNSLDEDTLKKFNSIFLGAKEDQVPDNELPLVSPFLLKQKSFKKKLPGEE